MSWRWSVGLAVAVALVAPAAGVPAHGADGGRTGPPPAAVAGPAAVSWGMSALDRRRMLAQIPLDDAAARVRAVSAESGGGLTDLTVDADHNTLSVAWSGSVPARAAELFARLRSRMAVRVTAARYSSAQLRQAVESAYASARRAGLDVAVVGPRADNTAVDLVVAGSQLASPRSWLAPTAVPVHVSTGVAGRLFTRADDMPPYRGGALIVNDRTREDDRPPYRGGALIVNNRNGDGCSTGFGVHSTVNADRYMLTAGHCGDAPPTRTPGDLFFNGTGRHELGNMTDNGLTQKSRPHDEAMIKTAPETASGNAIYDGAGIPAGDTRGYKIVAGEQAANKGDWVCLSGARSGTVCKLRIKLVGQIWKGGRYDTQFACQSDKSDIQQACQSAGNVGQEGDSGGAIFSLAANNKVTAKGIDIGAQPYKGVDYLTLTPIQVITSDFKVAVNIGG